VTIKDQLLAIQTALTRWTGDNKGKLFIASDPYHIVFLLLQAPGAMRVCILFHAEMKRGEHEESGMVDRTYWVVISRGQGMKLAPGASLTEGVSGGTKAMFDLCDEGREIIRGIEFDSSTEVSPNWKGMEPFPIPGYLTDAYRLEFSIGCQLDAATTPLYASANGVCQAIASATLSNN
jgi:hypothetical protein